MGRGPSSVEVGGAVGIAISLGIGRLVEGFGVDGLDPVALLSAPAVLPVITGAAAIFPARRASRVDPVRALRTE